LIAPGTKVNERPPAGWSDLVIKSVPKLESGDLDTLPSFAGTTATLFRTVILADVRRNASPRGGYRLARVGLGLCVNAAGDDTIVTRENASSSAVSLGLVERKVLELAVGELQKARLIARAERFAVLASPSSLLLDGRHEPIVLLYALSVEPKRGTLSVVVWAFTSDPKRKAWLEPPSLLAPRLVYSCGLDVQAIRVFGTLPVNWTFAMRSLPPHTPLSISTPLRPWLTDPTRIAGDPERFESLILEALENPRPNDRVGRSRSVSQPRPNVVKASAP
jgi:hypothetical protein